MVQQKLVTLSNWRYWNLTEIPVLGIWDTLQGKLGKWGIVSWIFYAAFWLDATVISLLPWQANVLPAHTAQPIDDDSRNDGI